MGSDSDYEEDFIEEDVDADSAEEEELEARIAEEHVKFQQAQEERQARVRETRGWSAPPLESPNPSEQKERKIESAKLSTPEAAASLTVPREDYDPPPRASAGKPSVLQDILEGEEGSSAKTPMGSRHSGAGEQIEEGITPSAAAAAAAAPAVQAVDASGQASGHAEEGVEEEKEEEGDEASSTASKGDRPGSALSLGRETKPLAKEDEAGDAESGSSEGEQAADGTGDGGGSDEDGEEDGVAGLMGGAVVPPTKPPPLHAAPPSTLTVGSSKVIVASDAGRWVVGDQSSDSLPGLKPKVEEGNEEEEESEGKSKPGVTPPKVTPAAAVMAVLAPVPAPATPPQPPAPAAASPPPPAPASTTPVPAAVIPTSLPPPSTKAPVIDDSDVSIVDDDGESIDESPIAHEKPPLVSKPDRSTLAHGAGATRVPPWAVSKPGRYDGATPSEVGSASAWSRGSGKGDDRRGGAGSEDGEGSDQGKAEEVDARMEPHQFALKLLMHDLRTLPAHRQAVSAAAPPQARRPGSAKAKSRYHESAVAAVLALDSKESTTQIRPSATSGRPGRPSSAPTARSVDTTPKSQPSTSKTLTKRLVSSAVPKSRGPPSVTSSVGWSTTGGADGTLRTSHMLRAPASERDEAPLTTERTPGRLTAELLSGRGNSWDGGYEQQQEGRGWSSPATAAVKQRPMSARPGYTAAGSASIGARGVPPRPRPFSAQLPGGQRASLEGTPATAFGAWAEAGGAGSGPGAHSGAQYPISGNAAAVEIYTSSTQKQVAAANRCLAALGSNRRYRTRTPTDNMNVQLVVQGYGDGDGEVTVLKTLNVTQFMAVLRQLKAKVRAQQQQQQAKPSLASLASAAGYTNDLDSDWVSPITTLWEGDNGNSIIGTKGSDGLIFRASEMDDWLLGGGDEGYDGMGPDASLPPPLPEDDPADQAPSVTQAVHEKINAAARRCQELAMQISMLQQDVPKGRQQDRQGRRW